MNVLNRKSLLFVIFPFVMACTVQQDLIVDYSDAGIAYSGRIDTTRMKAADLYWSGTSIKLNFEGESIFALMDDERGDNYYNIILDGDSIFVLKTDTVQHYYPLATDLSDGSHSIEIFKRTEWDRGRVTFYGFKITGNSKVLPAAEPKKRKIEFYGNSISAGYAVDDFSGQDRSDSIFTNHYLSYPRLTATQLDAEYRCICKSGIGIMISWFPLIMPEMYDRLIPTDSTSHWDFSLYTPDVVVINLFQNDSWLVNMPDHLEFKARFGTEAPDEEFIVASYASFVRSVREKYADAHIICALGNMDATREGSPWPGYIGQAVEQLGDAKMHTHFMPYKDSPGHPTIAEQEVMAISLSQFIEDNIASW